MVVNGVIYKCGYPLVVKKIFKKKQKTTTTGNNQMEFYKEIYIIKIKLTIVYE